MSEIKLSPKLRVKVLNVQKKQIEEDIAKAEAEGNTKEVADLKKLLKDTNKAIKRESAKENEKRRERMIESPNNINFDFLDEKIDEA